MKGYKIQQPSFKIVPISALAMVISTTKILYMPHDLKIDFIAVEAGRASRSSDFKFPPHFESCKTQFYINIARNSHIGFLRLSFCFLKAEMVILFVETMPDHGFVSSSDVG